MSALFRGIDWVTAITDILPPNKLGGYGPTHHLAGVVHILFRYRRKVALEERVDLIARGDRVGGVALHYRDISFLLCSWRRHLGYLDAVAGMRHISIQM
jgi:hypothetical protein